MAADPSGRGPRDVQRLARWLDEAFTIPGTRYRIGWDGIIGLIPGVGDLLTAAPALWIVLRAVNLGVPNTVVARMVLNAGLDRVFERYDVRLLGTPLEAIRMAEDRELFRVAVALKDLDVTSIITVERPHDAAGWREAAGGEVLDGAHGA